MAKEERTGNQEECQELKRCSKCKEIKPFESFSKDKHATTGRSCSCKECDRLYRLKVRDKAKVYKKQYYKNNQDKITKYNEEHKERKKEVGKIYRSKNKDKAREYNKEYRKQNTEKLRQQAKEYAKANKEKIKVYKRHHQRKRAATLKGKLNARMSAGIRVSLKDGKQGAHWEDLTGYNIATLIKHLKKKLPDGVTWEYFKNHTGDFHLDHIIPKTVFNYQTPDDIDFQKCWALTNLQILPAKENRKKWCKIDKPFQPSLAFSGRLQ